jgi:hypothetical protein
VLISLYYSPLFLVALSSFRLTGNDLRANEGRETKALNCKPITNLKEKSELSNYCKPAAFVLHAVIGCFFIRVIT